MGTVSSGISPDEAIFIPYQTGIKYITGKEISPTITVVAGEVDQVDTVMERVQAVLGDLYGDRVEFTISDADVLFVSVKERTNEIGILKAIGCDQKNILMEFLLEASCISLIGAVLGVLVSLGITPILESFSVRVELSLWGAALSLIFGVLTGTVFGFYPAYKASRLVPVAALSAE